jgi:hypothetical protein
LPSGLVKCTLEGHVTSCPVCDKEEFRVGHLVQAVGELRADKTVRLTIP